MKLSIVIPTFNRADDLRLCLESIFRQDFDPVDYQVIVVDNGPSTDKTEEYVNALTKKYINLKYFKTKETGVTFARNYGFQRSQAEIVLTTDDDIELLNSGILFKLMQTFRDKTIGMVGSLELKEKRDGSNILIKEAPNFKKIGKITKWGSFFTDYETLDGYNALVEVDHFRSCFMAIRKELFKAVGGFDEIYNSDAMAFRCESDVCLSVKKMGYKVVINPELRIWHKTSPRARGFDRGKNKRHLLFASRNHMFFMLKFFWSEHKHFWFWYDFLIGSYRAPGIFYLLKRREFNISNIKTVFQGKKWGYKMYVDYVKS